MIRGSQFCINLQTLTILTPKKVKFECKEVDQKSFDKAKKTVLHNTLIVYTHFDK